MAYTHSWFRHERLGIAARCCGAAERLIFEATKFAKDREASGTKIKISINQSMLADSVNLPLQEFYFLKFVKSTIIKLMSKFFMLNAQ